MLSRLVVFLEINKSLLAESQGFTKVIRGSWRSLVEKITKAKLEGVSKREKWKKMLPTWRS